MFSCFLFFVDLYPTLILVNKYLINGYYRAPNQLKIQFPVYIATLPYNNVVVKIMYQNYTFFLLETTLYETYSRRCKIVWKLFTPHLDFFKPIGKILCIFYLF